MKKTICDICGNDAVPACDRAFIVGGIAGSLSVTFYSSATSNEMDLCQFCQSTAVAGSTPKPPKPRVRPDVPDLGLRERLRQRLAAPLALADPDYKPDKPNKHKHGAP